MFACSGPYLTHVAIWQVQEPVSLVQLASIKSIKSFTVLCVFCTLLTILLVYRGHPTPGGHQTQMPPPPTHTHPALFTRAHTHNPSPLP
jgi:hypothetical protein